MDGHIELINQMLTNMICSMVRDKPKAWDLALAQVELAFNNMINRCTRFVPFIIVYTKTLNVVVDLRELPPGVTHKSVEAPADQILE